jgi:hypothetical protein
VEEQKVEEVEILVEVDDMRTKLRDRAMSAPADLTIQEVDRDEEGLTGMSPIERRKIFAHSSPRNSDVFGYDEDYEDDHDSVTSEGGRDRTTSQDTDVTSRQAVLFGYKLPLWWHRRPSCNRISTAVVHYAPCFWWCGSRLVTTSTTDRFVLVRLNILNAFFAFGQIVAGVWLGIVLFSEKWVDRNNELKRDESQAYTPVSVEI